MGEKIVLHYVSGIAYDGVQYSFRQVLSPSSLLRINISVLKFGFIRPAQQWQYLFWRFVLLWSEL